MNSFSFRESLRGCVVFPFVQNAWFTDDFMFLPSCGIRVLALLVFFSSPRHLA